MEEKKTKKKKEKKEEAKERTKAFGEGKIERDFLG